MLLSTLNRYVNAMGGKLDLVARHEMDAMECICMPRTPAVAHSGLSGCRIGIWNAAVPAHLANCSAGKLRQVDLWRFVDPRIQQRYSCEHVVAGVAGHQSQSVVEGSCRDDQVGKGLFTESSG